MFIILPCALVQEVEQVAVAYVLPIAECDLQLSLENKGILISVNSIGTKYC